MLHVKNVSSDTPSVTESCEYRKDISMSVGHNKCCVRVLDPRTLRVKKENKEINDSVGGTFKTCVN